MVDPPYDLFLEEMDREEGLFLELSCTAIELSPTWTYPVIQCDIMSTVSKLANHANMFHGWFGGSLLLGTGSFQEE